MAIEVMKAQGFPYQGFIGIVEEHWADIPKAHTGWAVTPDLSNK
jgi:hypothetical protein